MAGELDRASRLFPQLVLQVRLDRIVYRYGRVESYPGNLLLFPVQMDINVCDEGQ